MLYDEFVKDPQLQYLWERLDEARGDEWHKIKAAIAARKDVVSKEYHAKYIAIVKEHKK
jgi:hypothetical protein